MPQADISFANKQGTGLEELAGSPGVAMNVVVDASGAIRRRPGLQAATNVYSGSSGEPLTGIYATTAGLVYAVGSTPQFRQIYQVNTGSSVPLAQPFSDGTLGGVGRPTFAETQLLLAIAGAGPMEKVVLNGSLTSRIADNPPYASHVVANSSRLLGNLAFVSANNTFDKDVVRFSDIANGNTSYAGMEVWTEGLSTAGHFSCEASPDPVVAIAQNTNEVFCFGTTSLQVFDPDPTAVYAPACTVESGCSAPYSVVKVDQQFAWLDHLRRFIISDGRTTNEISQPIWKTLSDMTTVSDCFGYRVVDGQADILVWTFPTDGRTFAFQQGSGWAEWSSWSDATNNWAPFGVTASCRNPATQETLAAINTVIGRFNVDATTDFGTRINARVHTGYLARGTDERKHCKCVRVALRRGQNGTPGPQAYLSWRDAPGAFGAPLAIDLGSQGDTEIVLEFRSLGVYRRRQWQFEFSGTEPLELVSVTEDFDVLST
jgi:hypothetical protein